MVNRPPLVVEIRPAEMESSFFRFCCIFFFAYGENKILLQVRHFSRPKYLITEHAIGVMVGVPVLWKSGVLSSKFCT